MEDGIRLGLTEPSREPRWRGFGAGLAVLLAVFAALSWRKGGRAVPAYAAGALASALLAWLKPAWLEPVYRPWMKVAGVLAEVNTTLILAVVYYAVFTPYALLLRAFGRDPLDRGGKGGWIAREPRTDYASYERPF